MEIVGPEGFRHNPAKESADDLAEIAAALRARRVRRFFRLADRHRKEVELRR